MRLSHRLMLIAMIGAVSAPALAGGLGELAPPLRIAEWVKGDPAVLEEGKRKIVSFFPLVKVRYLEEVEIDRFDREHLSFFNINTQADLDRARALVQPNVGQSEKRAASAHPEALP